MLMIVIPWFASLSRAVFQDMSNMNNNRKPLVVDDGGRGRGTHAGCKKKLECEWVWMSDWLDFAHWQSHLFGFWSVEFRGI